MGLLDWITGGKLPDVYFRPDAGRGLLDAANRGAVGGLLGAPVDAATGLLNAAIMAGGYLGHKAGLKADKMPQPIENPVGGSEWIGELMQRAGMVSGNRNPVAEAIASIALPMGAPRAAQAAYKGEQALAPKAAQMAQNAVENYMVKNGLIQPATVWHGSPHKFDKFDSSKIGTGEGAQAYGHGLYLAETADVAKNYYVPRDLSYEGKLMALYKQMERRQNYDAMDVVEQAMQHATPAELRAQYGSAAEPVIKQIERIPYNSGSLYKVDLPDSAISRMLDWDKPLSQQAQNVNASLENLKKANPQGYQRLVDAQLGGPLMDQATGMDLYRNLIRGANERQMVDVMRQQGIPGIRYLDGGSRGAGSGTSNFVVFPGEESLLKILERNGIPLP